MRLTETCCRGNRCGGFRKIILTLQIPQRTNAQRLDFPFEHPAQLLQLPRVALDVHQNIRLRPDLVRRPRLNVQHIYAKVLESLQGSHQTTDLVLQREYYRNILEVILTRIGRLLLRNQQRFSSKEALKFFVTYRSCCGHGGVLLDGPFLPALVQPQP